MTPELFRALKEKSKKEGISMNDIINQLLEAYVRQS
jgi:predicted HicB family RNase H-like nuclease